MKCFKYLLLVCVLVSVITCIWLTLSSKNITDDSNPSKVSLISIENHDHDHTSTLQMDNNTIKTIVPCQYLGWLGHKNMGDKVMYQVFEYMNQLNIKYKFEIYNSPKSRCFNFANMSCALLGGGSLISGASYTKCLKPKNMLNGMFGSGTDDDVVFYGRKPYNQSFGNNYTQNILKVYKIATMDPTKRAFCDSISIEIIKRHRKVLRVNPMMVRGYISRLLLDCTYIRTPKSNQLYPHYSLTKPMLIGDSGILGYKLLNSVFDLNEDMKWFNNKINSFKMNSNAIKIAVNIGGGQYRYKYRIWERYRDNDTILNIYTEGLLKFNDMLDGLQLQLQIVIWSIWPADNKIAQRLYDSLKNNTNINVYNLGFIRSPANIIRLHKMCNMSLTYKLHAMILSHSALCPGVHLIYRLKGLDHASAVDLMEYAIGTDIVTADIIVNKLLTVFNNLLLLQKHLQNAVNTIEIAYKEWWDRINNVLNEKLTL